MISAYLKVNANINEENFVSGFFQVENEWMRQSRREQATIQIKCLNCYPHCIPISPMEWHHCSLYMHSRKIRRNSSNNNKKGATCLPEFHFHSHRMPCTPAAKFNFFLIKCQFHVIQSTNNLTAFNPSLTYFFLLSTMWLSKTFLYFCLFFSREKNLKYLKEDAKNKNATWHQSNGNELFGKIWVRNFFSTRLVLFYYPFKHICFYQLVYLLWVCFLNMFSNKFVFQFYFLGIF